MEEPSQINPPEPIEQPIPAQKRSAHWVFVGDGGIRAGWSALIFIAILAALASITIFAFSFFLRSHPRPKGPMSPGLGLFQEVLLFVVIFVATVIMSRIEKRSIGRFGYSGQSKFARFCWGILWGFIAISALVGTLWKFHLLVFDGTSMRGIGAWEYAAAWALAFFFVGLAEESLLRGYLQYTLARGIGFWWAALLLSFSFGAMHGHNPGESPIGLLSAGAVGLVFCLSLWYTGSLWWAIGFHAAWDWGQSYFYGTNDSGAAVAGHLISEHPTGSLLWSGGLTGPEGSLLIIPLLMVMAIAMWVWWGRRPAAWSVENS
ncbi:MAG TPA: type II CAAX endopeptidase family protein [Pseudacidobacterium sp.]|nr:type II CAAX endopeptidase family protein [Pseudacidobacterium sp.]